MQNSWVGEEEVSFINLSLVVRVLNWVVIDYLANEREKFEQGFPALQVNALITGM